MKDLANLFHIKQLQYKNGRNQPVSLVVEHCAIGAGGLGLIPRRVESNTGSPTTRHRCDVSLKLFRGDGADHSLHALV